MSPALCALLVHRISHTMLHIHTCNTCEWAPWPGGLGCRTSIEVTRDTSFTIEEGCVRNETIYFFFFPVDFFFPLHFFFAVHFFSLRAFFGVANNVTASFNVIENNAPSPNNERISVPHFT